MGEPRNRDHRGFIAHSTREPLQGHADAVTAAAQNPRSRENRARSCDIKSQESAKLRSMSRPPAATISSWSDARRRQVDARVAASRSCRRWPAQLLEVSMVASVAGIIRGQRADPPLLALARSSQRDAAFRARINRVLLVARTLPSSAVGDVDRPAHADRGKKFMPRLGVVPEHTQHAARDHADAGLVDAAGGHALMRRLGDDGDAVRL